MLWRTKVDFKSRVLGNHETKIKTRIERVVALCFLSNPQIHTTPPAISSVNKRGVKTRAQKAEQLCMCWISC